MNAALFRQLCRLPTSIKGRLRRRGTDSVFPAVTRQRLSVGVIHHLVESVRGASSARPSLPRQALRQVSKQPCCRRHADPRLRPWKGARVGPRSAPSRSTSSPHSPRTAGGSPAAPDTPWHRWCSSLKIATCPRRARDSAPFSLPFHSLVSRRVVRGSRWGVSTRSWRLVLSLPPTPAQLSACCCTVAL